MLLGYPDTKNVFAAGAIFISSIRTSVTVLLESCPKSLISAKKEIKNYLKNLAVTKFLSKTLQRRSKSILRPHFTTFQPTNIFS